MAKGVLNFLAKSKFQSDKASAGEMVDRLESLLILVSVFSHGFRDSFMGERYAFESPNLKKVHSSNRILLPLKSMKSALFLHQWLIRAGEFNYNNSAIIFLNC